jgi:transketolase
VLAERYPVTVHRLGIQDEYGQSGPTLDLLERYGLSGGAVARAILELARVPVGSP